MLHSKVNINQHLPESRYSDKSEYPNLTTLSIVPQPKVLPWRLLIDTVMMMMLLMMLMTTGMMIRMLFLLLMMMLLVFVRSMTMRMVVVVWTSGKMIRCCGRRWR